MIGFRSDGNAFIGTGHIMRCISIAKQIVKAGGGNPLFLCAEGKEIVEKAGFSCVKLNGDYDNILNDGTAAEISRNGITTLVVDTYFAGRSYFEKISKFVNTVRIFDCGDDTIPCDVVLDYNMNFGEFVFPNAKIKLLGPRYAPLREEFEGVGIKRVIKDVRRVLITTGGGDELNVTESILNAVLNDKELRELEYHVAIGKLNRWAERLRSIETVNNNVICHMNAKNMSELLLMCDVVLSAGGSTMYEIFATGTPCVAFSIAENQNRMIEVMDKSGMVLSAGILNGDVAGGTCRITDLLKKFMADQKIREDFSSKIREAVDGKGACRVAYEIVKLDGKS